MALLWVFAKALLLASCGGDGGDVDPVADAHPEAKPLFTALDIDASGIAFRNDLRPTEELNIITYLYYYNGGGVAVGDVTGDGLPDLYFGANQGPDALYVNEGGLRFRENTSAAGLSTASDWTSGVSLADVDDDGDLDLYVCKVSGVAGLTGRNELYLNDGAGNFAEAAEERGLAFAGLSTQAAFFDADGDGDQDVYLLNHSTHATGRGRSASAREVPDAVNGDRLLLQGEDGRFVDATAGSGLYSSSLGYGLGIIVADLIGDPKPDLYVANDFDERDYLYENLGGGRFADRAALPNTSQFSMGNAAADFDADGLLDVLTLDMRPYSDSVRKSSSGSSELGSVRSRLLRGYGSQFPRNSLHTRRGDGFVDVAVQAQIHSTDWSWAPAVLDADLDGYADVVVGNGIVTRPNDLDYLRYSSSGAIQRGATNLELAGLMPAGLVPNRAFRGRPGAPFEEVASAWGLDVVGSTTAIVAADLDGDGDEDLITNNVNAPALLFENTTVTGAGSAPAGVRVRIVRGPHDAPAVGASVTVSQGLDWRRTFAVQAVTGFQSSAVVPLVIGLPEPEAPFALEVTSPTGHSGRFRSSQREVVINTDTLDKVGSPAERDWIPRPAQSPYAYNDFDVAPLQPVISPRRSPDALVKPNLRSARRELRDLLEHPPPGIDTANVTAVRALGNDRYVLTELWAPVRLLRRASTGEWRVERALTAPGLWFGVVPVDGDDEQLVLSNIGLNTLLTEHADQQIELHVADWDGNGRLDPIAVRVDGDERTTLLGLDPIAKQMPQMRKFFRRYLPFSASRFDRLFPPTAGVGGRVYRADELRSHVLDLAEGTVRPLRWELQAATPIAVAYDATGEDFTVQLTTPTLRPELMARNQFTVEVDDLTGVHDPAAHDLAPGGGR